MTNDVPSSSSQNPQKIPNSQKAEPKLSIISIVCRICYDNEKEEELISPCNCKGTVAFVHRSCLEIWLGESNTTTCELCHQIFKTERTPKYTSGHSIFYWCRYSSPENPSRVRSDVLACAVITPLAIVITYVCLFSSEYYSQKKFSNVPAARWTSVSLLVMIGIMLIGYYMWVYSVMRMHARMWYNWWQRTCDVRYIPTNTNTGRVLNRTIDRTQQTRRHPDINDVERGQASNQRLADKSQLSGTTRFGSLLENINHNPESGSMCDHGSQKSNIILFELCDD